VAAFGSQYVDKLLGRPILPIGNLPVAQFNNSNHTVATAHNIDREKRAIDSTCCNSNNLRNQTGSRIGRATKDEKSFFGLVIKVLDAAGANPTYNRPPVLSHPFHHRRNLG